MKKTATVKKTPTELAKLEFDEYAGMGGSELPNCAYSELQVRLSRWQNRNFGSTGSLRILAGVVEEVGELSHALLKGEQGIRGYDRAKVREEVGDAIADAGIYLMQMATNHRLDFWTLLFATAEDEVLPRDWVEYPDTGRPPGGSE